MTNEIALPSVIQRLYRAHSELCAHFADTGLRFTLDGRLVGDIGEALAAEAFGLVLCRTRTPGVDGHAPDGRSVQVKATGDLKSGPAFTPGEGVADHLLFLRIDFNNGKAIVTYNGPEAPIRQLLPVKWSGTKVVRLSQIDVADLNVRNEDRLPRIG